MKELVQSALSDGSANAESRVGADVRTLTMCMWKLREHPNVIGLLSEMLTLHSDEKATFDAIEFYLPQIAHMIVHLEVDWPSSALENFALMVAQQSLHFALQLSWFLIGCMEDYEPENEEGAKNPNADPLLYLRCATLLHHIERCVVYGTPREPALRKLYMEGRAAPEEVREAEMADRRFLAAQIANDDSPESFAWTHSGILGYKRWVKKSRFSTKGWRMRMFKVRHRVLLCYRASDGYLKRAIPLQHTIVEIKTHHTHKFYFELKETKRRRVYKLYASSKAEMDQWIKVLREEAAAPPPSTSLIDRSTLNISQIARYGSYKSERDFVRTLCDVCEDMRFVDRPKRKVVLKKVLNGVTIPGCVYIPLCRSTDPWSRVVKIVPEKAHPFSTKERCPCLMVFETASESPVPVDVASYLHQTLGIGMSVDEDEGDDDDDGADADEEETESDASPDQTTLSPNSKSIEARRSFAAMASDVGSKVLKEDEHHKIVKRSKSKAAMRTVAKAVKSAAKKVRRRRRKTKKESEAKLGLWEDNAADANASSTEDEAISSPTPSESEEASSKESKLRKAEHEKQIRMQVAAMLTASTSVSGTYSVDSSASGSAPSSQRAHARNGSHGEFLPSLGRAARGKSASENAHASAKFDEVPLSEEKIAEAAKKVSGGATADRDARMRSESAVARNLQGWGITRLIAKSNDDLRQEVFIMQCIQYLHDCWLDAGLPIWVKPYRILSTSQTTGLIELINDSNSFDGLKKDLGKGVRLIEHFKKAYGAELPAASMRFARSMAGYSLICWILGIKDRHNGNILLTAEGNVVHIDFGFVFGMAPGKDKIPHTNFSMETAPFKFTSEMLEVMGGKDGEAYQQFVEMLIDGMLVARKNCETLMCLVEIMSYRSKLPCFNQPGGGPARVLRELRQRLFLDKSDDQIPGIMRRQVKKSLSSRGTIIYEKFQKWSNDIEPIF